MCAVCNSLHGYTSYTNEIEKIFLGWAGQEKLNVTCIKLAAIKHFYTSDLQSYTS